MVAAGIARFRDELNELAEGFYAPSQWEPEARFDVDYGPSGSEFLQHYDRATSWPVDYPAAQSYAAGLIVQRCVEETGCLEPRDLRAVAGELRLTTFFGPFGIDARTGRQLAHQMLVTQWQGGKKVVC